MDPEAFLNADARKNQSSVKRTMLTLAVGAALGFAGCAAIFGTGSADQASAEAAQSLWLGAPIGKPTWTQLPGAGWQDTAAGVDGSLWAIGKDGSIQYLSKGVWTKIDGAAVRIAVDRDGNPWVVNAAGNLYQRAGGAWRQRAPGGSAKDLGVGSDGSVWITDANQLIRRLDTHTDSFTTVEGRATQISVGPDGRPWVTNEAGGIFERVGSAWVQRPGCAKDIAVGADASVWVIGCNSAGDGNSIHRY